MSLQKQNQIMESDSLLVHVLLISFPGQGHVNPLLRLGKLLAANGLLVTFTTTEDFGKHMKKANKIKDGEAMPVGEGFICFEFFKDGWEEDDPRRVDAEAYIPQLELSGKREIPRLVQREAEEKHPVSCLIFNAFVPWVSDVAQELGLPSAVLWVQSCACFAAYYHYNLGLVEFPTEDEPKIDVQIPSMPLLKHDEFPSFLHPHSPYPQFRRLILKLFKKLDYPFCVLMDTFYELENETVDYMSKLCPIKTIGPLFKNPKTRSTGVCGDMLAASEDCIEWLDTQASSSVVYISFGTVVYLKQEQIDEIAHGLLSSGLSFLWVIRQPPKQLELEPHVLPEELLMKGKGKVVEWAPQEQVLAHPAIACFLTHCGWNSSMEVLTSGVRVAAFPQWGDQVTNALYLTDVFKIGVRMCRGEAENRIIPRDEVEKCLLEVTEGDRAAEMKENALKWKAMAEAVLAEGGSSDNNIQDFINVLSRKS